MNRLIPFLFLAVTGCLLAQEPGSQRAPKTPWELIRAEHDKDRDGRVTKEEYSRGAERFQRLDQNGDGVLTEPDFAARSRGGGRPGNGNAGAPGTRFLSRALGLRPGESMTLRQFDEWLKKQDTDADGFISETELADRVPPRLRAMVLDAVDADGDGKISRGELTKTFEGADSDRDGKVTSEELGARQVRRGAGRDRPDRAAASSAPNAGEIAPDFDLPFKTGPERAKLSSFREKKPVALIFGSYT